MLKEEFELLSGVKVSHDHYTFVIEAEYYESSFEKADYVKKWLKDNEGNFCKTLKSEIDAFDEETIKRTDIEDEHEKLIDISEALEKQNQKLKSENEQLKTENDEYKEKLKKSEYDLIILKATMFDYLYIPKWKERNRNILKVANKKDSTAF